MFLSKDFLNEDEVTSSVNKPERRRSGHYDTHMERPDLDDLESPRDENFSQNIQSRHNFGNSTRDESKPGDDVIQATPQSRREKLMRQKKALEEKRRNRNSQFGMVRADESMGSPVRSTSPLSGQNEEVLFKSRHFNGTRRYDSGMNDRFSQAEKQSRQSPVNEAPDRQLSHIERELMDQGISPVYDPVERKQFTPAQPVIQATDIPKFLNTPVDQHTIVQCYITRNKATGLTKLYPEYELYLGDGTFLLGAKRRAGNKTSNYLVTMVRGDYEKKSKGFVGKVRSNFVGTEFTVYDAGLNPKNLGKSPVTEARKELASCHYESNILSSRGPRKMSIAIPRVHQDNTSVVFRPIGKGDTTLAEALKSADKHNTMMLVNKTPKWNDKVQAYVLNFNGRVTQASVKNFQLVSSDDPDRVILQFGRVGNDKFNMDISWPITPLQAFGICLSSFDHKLACE